MNYNGDSIVVSVRDGELDISGTNIRYITINGVMFNLNGDSLPSSDSRYIEVLRMIDCYPLKDRGYSLDHSKKIKNHIKKVLK